MLPALLALANLAPVLMKYLGGTDSTVGKVVTAASEIATTLTGEKTPEEAVVALSKDPEKLAQFQLQVTQQSIEWDKLFLADVQSARDRDVKLAQAGYRNIRAHSMYLLAVCVIILLVFIIWKDPNINEYVKGIFTLVLGRFLGYLDNIYNFEFGTTRASKQKDETIDRLTK